MSEQLYVIALVVTGLCFLGLLALAIVALCLGRPLRAASRLRIGQQHELSLGLDVDVPRNSSDLLTQTDGQTAVHAIRSQSSLKQLGPPKTGAIEMVQALVDQYNRKAS